MGLLKDLKRAVSRTLSPDLAGVNSILGIGSEHSLWTRTVGAAFGSGEYDSLWSQTVGEAGRNVGNVIKDLTGASAAEETLKQGERAAAKEELRREQALKDEQAKMYRDDLAKSKAAASSRATASVQAGAGFGGISVGNRLGINLGDSNNFLGL